jgi:hypothetical protein
MAHSDYRFLEKRAQEEFALAKTAQDRSVRSIHLKFAKCYHDLARAIEVRQQIRANASLPGRKH